MSINTEKEGFKFAVIKKKDEGNKVYKKLYVSSDKDDGVQDFEVKKNCEIQIIPSDDADRARTFYVSGPAGSGKSYWTGAYVQEFHKKWKDRPIFLFSEKPKDPALDFDYVQRINLDTILKEPITYDEVLESCPNGGLLIFDDIDALSRHKKVLVYDILNKCLALGRSAKLYCIYTCHSATNSSESKVALQEAQVIVFFPMNYNRQLKYLLENYIGCDKTTINKILESKSRWVAYIKGWPCLFVDSHRAWTQTYKKV
jgi:hypothetical protein